jgi:DNA-binding MarR family transcriptional regulator
MMGRDMVQTRRNEGRAGESEPVRLTYLVTRLQWALRGRLDEITQRFDLTPKQYTALSVLAERPGMSSATLARFTNVTPQASNEMVAVLERKGFLERSTDQADARRLEMTLTRAGRTALTKCDELVDRLEREVFDLLDATQQETFRTMLDTCLQATHRVEPLPE